MAKDKDLIPEKPIDQLYDKVVKLLKLPGRMPINSSFASAKFSGSATERG